MKWLEPGTCKIGTWLTNECSIWSRATSSLAYTCDEERRVMRIPVMRAEDNVLLAEAFPEERTVCTVRTCDSWSVVCNNAGTRDSATRSFQQNGQMGYPNHALECHDVYNSKNTHTHALGQCRKTHEAHTRGTTNLKGRYWKSHLNFATSSISSWKGTLRVNKKVCTVTYVNLTRLRSVARHTNISIPRMRYLLCL